MNKICTNCGNEFEAKRESARYCSDKCRTAHSRSVTDKPVSVTDGVSVTDSETDSVTLKDSETRQWLIRQFEAEGKPPDEIRDIMIAQDSFLPIQGLQQK